MSSPESTRSSFDGGSEGRLRKSSISRDRALSGGFSPFKNLDVSEKHYEAIDGIEYQQKLIEDELSQNKSLTEAEAKMAAEEAKKVRETELEARTAQKQADEERRMAELEATKREVSETNHETRQRSMSEVEAERIQRANEDEMRAAEEKARVKAAAMWAKEEHRVRELERQAEIQAKLEKAAVQAKELNDSKMDGMSRFLKQQEKMKKIEAEQERLEEERKKKAEEERLRKEEEERLRLVEEERLRKEEEEKKREEERLRAEEEERQRQEDIRKKAEEEEARERKRQEEAEAERRREEQRALEQKEKELQAKRALDMEGYLSKRGGSRVDGQGTTKLFTRKNWNRRYFRLNAKSNELAYYKAPSDPQPAGSFKLGTCTIDTTYVSGKETCISIESPGRKGFVMVADNEEETRGWLEKLRLHTTR